MKCTLDIRDFADHLEKHTESFDMMEVTILGETAFCFFSDRHLRLLQASFRVEHSTYFRQQVLGELMNIGYDPGEAVSTSRLVKDYELVTGKLLSFDSTYFAEDDFDCPQSIDWELFQEMLPYFVVHPSSYKVSLTDSSKEFYFLPFDLYAAIVFNFSHKYENSDQKRRNAGNRLCAMLISKSTSLEEYLADSLILESFLELTEERLYR